MSAPFDAERAAEILVDAAAMGDPAAAQRHGVATRTVRRYRMQAKTDKVLAAFVLEKKRAVEHELSVMRVGYMRKALRAMGRKLKTSSLEEIAESVKIVGELHHVGIAVEDEQPDSEDPAASEAEGSSGGAPIGPH